MGLYLAIPENVQIKKYIYFYTVSLEIGNISKSMFSISKNFSGIFQESS